jgi:hypothetical protein
MTIVINELSRSRSRGDDARIAQVLQCGLFRRPNDDRRARGAPGGLIRSVDLSAVDSASSS